jgi:hypothetical protein
MVPEAAISSILHASFTHKRRRPQLWRAFTLLKRILNIYRSSQLGTGKGTVLELSGERQALLYSMSFYYIIVLGLLFLNGRFVEAAAFTTPSATAMPEMSRVEPAQSSQLVPTGPSKLVTHPALTSLPPMSRITTPPSLNRLDLRQRCWNDQGFSVDCAVWTGYRYTWGPATNPYDYWSGNGGSGSGGGGAIPNDAIKAQTTPSFVSFLRWSCLLASALLAWYV